MSLSTLCQLESFCLTNTKLQNSRGVGLLKKLAIFINILSHHTSNREVQEHFPYFGITVSLCFLEILAAMLILYVKYVYSLQLLDLTSNIILQNKKYRLYFNNCVNTLNETYITIHKLTIE